MAKKLSVMQEIENERLSIRKSVDRWNELIMGGSSDPFWPDGVNLNLVRNHIIYGQNKILQLCEENGIFVPEEATYDLPPKVPDNLYVRETDGVVYERISSFHALVFPESPVPVYNPQPIGQMSLW